MLSKRCRSTDHSDEKFDPFFRAGWGGQWFRGTGCRKRGIEFRIYCARMIFYCGYGFRVRNFCMFVTY